ncbi:VOC family protein [Pseudoalteromonas sp. S16_S37]|uniref:VOC family protein n=1 Tax=Pseudoalteromonas sp. S16_S37 TaxID=2720228 RepID=UPI00168108D7|nr:VOC family protein [Pseudoalteromonas sp. S16_S37]MBD1584726.1 VOC family protein [Pseudoalteromonas sp. S16_S37]
MHKSRLAALVIDSKVDDIEQANTFWEQALGYARIDCDEEWSSRYTQLDTPDDQPQILIQKTEHESRVHLDIETDDIAAEVARLEAIGAKVVKTLERWVVMQAPTGHRFCVVHPQRSDFDEADNVNVWE